MTKFKASFDRGNGWKQTKAEWSDVDKAEDKTVTPEELKEMRCPATGSSITSDMGHVLDGLKFYLDVCAKEYRENKKGYGGKYEYRKPTILRANIEAAAGIPVPGCSPMKGNWCEKKTWSSAVKLLTEDIIPIYEEAGNEAMCMWTVVCRDREAVS